MRVSAIIKMKRVSDLMFELENESLKRYSLPLGVYSTKEGKCVKV